MNLFLFLKDIASLFISLTMLNLCTINSLSVCSVKLISFGLNSLFDGWFRIRSCYMFGILVCAFILNVRYFCFLLLFSFSHSSFLINGFVVSRLPLPGAWGPVHNRILKQCLFYPCSVMIWGISQLHGTSRQPDPVPLRLSSFPVPIAAGKA